MRKVGTAKVREIAKGLSERRLDVTCNAVSEASGVQSYRDKKIVRDILYDLFRYGELERVERGVYRYVGKPKRSPQKQEIMWRFFRMQRTVALDDLRMIGEVSRDYAQEWISVLVNRGIARDLGNGKYQLIVDTLEMPRNREKAERLRLIRERKKAMLEAFKEAKNAIARAEAAALQAFEREEG